MLKSAIVGCGVISGFHAEAYRRSELAELAAVVDIDGEKAKAAGKKYGVPYYKRISTVLKRDDIDVISVCTPSGLHGKVAIAAAKAGKHCYCEKPLDVTPQRCDQIIAAFKESGTTLGGVFQHRFAPPVMEARKAVRDGRLGTLTFGACYTPWWRSQEYYDSGDWRGTWKLDGGGSLMNQSIHLIDLLLVMMGPVKRLAAATSLLAHKDIEVEDTAVAIVEFESGALGIIQGTTSMFPGTGIRVEVGGDKGTIYLKDDKIDLWELADGSKPTAGESEDAMENAGASDPTAIPIGTAADNVNNFLSAIVKGTPLEVTGEEAKKPVEVICAIYQSAKKGKWVDLPLNSFRP
ncbi:MAG: Gfo/Idh/MocA family oxidoreductase [Planctomycetia bacterium]|nr:Gfo/Idh/MocA family oxidoreductase [Planctomycetia bacterium]